MHVVWRLTLGSVCLQIAAMAAAEGRKAPMMLAVIYDELVRLVMCLCLRVCVCAPYGAMCFAAGRVGKTSQ